VLCKPDYFKLFDVMINKRAELEIFHGGDEPITVATNNETTQTAGLYRTLKGTPQTVSSISSELQKSGAFPKDSTLKARRMRHVSLSYVAHHIRRRLQEAILRSRHEEAIFERKYRLCVDDKTIAHLSALPRDAQLEDIGMGYGLFFIQQDFLTEHARTKEQANRVGHPN
jgi:hypothetical protein